jgi:hypothetical protein
LVLTFSRVILYLSQGWPDLSIDYPRGPYCGMRVENKIHPNRPTEEQLLCHERLRIQGYYVFVCYSLEEFISKFKWYHSLGAHRTQNEAIVVD